MNSSKNDQPVQGNFSVAVINESVAPVDEDNESTILSNVLLTSDIKGYIEQPNYYFDHPDSKTAAALDVLMLTQAYRRFDWKQLANNVTAGITYPVEKSPNISGTVKTRGGKPVPNAKVTMVRTQGVVFFTDTVADKNGRFTFTMDFADSTKFTLKATKPGGGEGVVIDMDKAPAVANNNKNKADVIVSLNKGLQSYLENSKNNMMMM